MKKILIVEDDADSRVLLEKGLRSKGFEVVSAANGVEALSALESAQVDMIISDIMMPRMDGYELCRQVKESSRWAAIPFVFYSATFVGEDDKRLGLSLGAAAYIVKPMELDDMIRVIQDIYDGIATGEAEQTVITRQRSEDIEELYHIVLSRKLEKKVAELEQERKRLAKSESKFRHLIEDLRREYFFFQCNAAGELTYVSPSIRDILGYSQEEFIGHFTDYLTGHSCNNEAMALRRSCIEGIEQEPYPLQIYHCDGEVHDLEITEHPVFDSDGRVIAVEGIAHDVTTVKSLERQFLQAQKMGALGTLVGGIAHDFNNILTGMLGAIYLAEHASGNAERVGKAFSDARELGFRAADMIRQLLAFARQEEAEKSTFRVAPFFKESMKFIERGLAENIRFHTVIGDESMLIRANATQLQQMLFNLVNNARDALAGSDDPEINISLDMFKADSLFDAQHPEVKQKRFARIEVCDNGEGIPEEHIDKLFTPFFTTKSAGKGTGLGLAMVYNAVRNHAGVIDVDSRPGEGSRFTVYLPLEEESEKQRVITDDDALYRGEGETILLVDDDVYLRETVQNILSDLGYKVLVAGDGRQALDVFQSDPDAVDLIITDMVMPNMSGPAAVEEIRRIKQDVRVIYLTGYDASLHLKLQPNEMVLNKPFRVNRLSRLIREQLA